MSFFSPPSASLVQDDELAAATAEILDAIDALACTTGAAGSVSGQTAWFVNAAAVAAAGDWQVISGEPLSMSAIGQVHVPSLAAAGSYESLGFATSTTAEYLYMTLSDGLHAFRVDAQASFTHARLNATNFSRVSGLATPVFSPAHTASAGCAVVGCALPSGRGLLVGASPGAAAGSLLALIYDPATAGFSYTTSLPERYRNGKILFSTARAAVCWVPAEKYPNAGSAWIANTNDVLFYDEGTATWTVETTAEDFPAGFHSLATRVNFIEIAGGLFVAFAQGLDTATWLFDPVALTVTPTAARPAGSIGVGSAGAPPRVFGDGTAAFVLRNADLYALDPAGAGTWNPVTPWLGAPATALITNAHAFNACGQSIGNPGIVLFPDATTGGRVIFTGGFTPRSAVLAQKL